jgi:hypothetical protein
VDGRGGRVVDPMWIGREWRRRKAASAAEELRKTSNESVDFGDEHAPVRCPTLVHARRTKAANSVRTRSSERISHGMYLDLFLNSTALLRTGLK